LAHGPRKKPFDFRVNPNHVTLGLGLGWVMVAVRRGPRQIQQNIQRGWMCVIPGVCLKVKVKVKEADLYSAFTEVPYTSNQ